MKNVSLLIKKNNPKEFFAYIDCKTKAKNSIPTLQLDGLTLDNDRAKAHAFMTQFSSVYSLDDGQLPYFPQVLPENTLIDLQVTQLDVLQALSSLAGKHSSGPDDLKADFLYKTRSHLVKPLQMIFNASLRSSDLPSDWKNAVVVPCYKRNNKPNCPASYRPISLTNICCKILEFIILKYLKAYFLESCINFNSQRGFIA